MLSIRISVGVIAALTSVSKPVVVVVVAAVAVVAVGVIAAIVVAVFL